MSFPQTECLQDDSMSEFPELADNLLEIDRPQGNDEKMLSDSANPKPIDEIVQMYQEQQGLANGPPYIGKLNNQEGHGYSNVDWSPPDDSSRYPWIAKGSDKPMEEEGLDEFMEGIELLTDPSYPKMPSLIQEAGNNAMDTAPQNSIESSGSVEEGMDFEQQNTYDSLQNSGSILDRATAEILDNDAPEQQNGLQMTEKSNYLEKGAVMNSRMENSDQFGQFDPQPAIPMSNNCGQKEAIDTGFQSGDISQMNFNFPVQRPVMGFGQHLEPSGGAMNPGFQSYSPPHSSGINQSETASNYPKGSYPVAQFTEPYFNSVPSGGAMSAGFQSDRLLPNNRSAPPVAYNCSVQGNEPFMGYGQQMMPSETVVAMHGGFQSNIFAPYTNSPMNYSGSGVGAVKDFGQPSQPSGGAMYNPPHSSGNSQSGTFYKHLTGSYPVAQHTGNRFASICPPAHTVNCQVQGQEPFMGHALQSDQLAMDFGQQTKSSGCSMGPGARHYYSPQSSEIIQSGTTYKHFTGSYPITQFTEPCVPFEPSGGVMNTEFQSDHLLPIDQPAPPVDSSSPVQGQKPSMGYGQQLMPFGVPMNLALQSVQFAPCRQAIPAGSNTAMGFEQQSQPSGDAMNSGAQRFNPPHSSAIIQSGITTNYPNGCYPVAAPTGKSVPAPTNRSKAIELILAVSEDSPHIRISPPQRNNYGDGRGDTHLINIQVPCATKNLQNISRGDESGQQLLSFDYTYSVDSVRYENNDNDMNVHPESEMVNYHPLEVSPISEHSSVLSVASSVSVNNNNNNFPVSPARSCKSQKSPRKPRSPRTRPNSVGKKFPASSKNAEKSDPRNSGTPRARHNSAASTRSSEEQRAKNREYAQRYRDKKEAERELAKEILKAVEDENCIRKTQNAKIEKNANFAVETLQIVLNETMRKEMNNVKETYELSKNAIIKKFEEQAESEALKIVSQKREADEKNFDEATANYAAKRGNTGTNGSSKTRKKQQLELTDAQLQTLLQQKKLDLQKELTALAERYFRDVVKRYLHAYKSIPEFKKAILSRREVDIEQQVFDKFLSKNQGLLKDDAIQHPGGS